jgi:hypothetical protein
MLLASAARAQEELLPQGLQASLTPSQSIEDSSTILDKRDYLLSTTALRFDGSYHRSAFEAVLDYDLDLREGDYFSTQDAAIAGRQAPRSALQFGNEISGDSRYRLDDRPYRAYLDWSERNWEVRAGVQRTTWSDGLAFSAVDFMHLHQPMDLSIDREPLDSVYARIGPFSTEYAPARLFNDAQGIARLGEERGGDSLYAYFGKVKEENSVRLLSPDFPSYMAGASVRIAIPGGRFLAEQATYHSDLSAAYDRSLVSIAWGRRDHEWLGFEYYYNGQGTSPMGYDPTLIVQGQAAVLGRQYFVAHLGDPESVRWLWNAADGSGMIEFAERRQISALNLAGGVQFFYGPANSEFNRYGDRLYASIGYRFFRPTL